jgi:hypothetical protein
MIISVNRKERHYSLSGGFLPIGAAAPAPRCANEAVASNVVRLKAA